MVVNTSDHVKVLFYMGTSSWEGKCRQENKLLARKEKEKPRWLKAMGQRAVVEGPVLMEGLSARVQGRIRKEMYGVDLLKWRKVMDR